MQIRFLLDLSTSIPHIVDHNVSEQEVIEVFENGPMRLRGRDGAMIALGQTFAGRYLKIIYREDDHGIFVITAYDLTGKALRAYRRRRRQGNR